MSARSRFVRIDRDALRTFLVGDLVAIALFVVAGELRHGVDPVNHPVYVFGTYLPFLVGWTISSPPTGAYADRVLRSRRGMLVTTFGAWVLAAAVAQVFRATSLFHGEAALTFFLVSVGVGGVVLLLWRTVRLALR